MKKIFTLFSFPLETDKRVYGLDIMRAMAILLVMTSHSRIFLGHSFPLFNQFHIMGFLGVELFFVLSGFLIGGILLKIFNSGNEIKLLDVKRFWVRRWFRTLPLFYLILLFNIVCALFVKNLSIHQYFPFFFFLQNFLWKQPKFFIESWSLTVEEWFYLFLPVCLLLNYLIFRKRMTVKFIFLSSAILFISISTVLRIIGVLEFDASWSKGIGQIVLFRLDSIIWGVLAAWVSFYHSVIWNKVKRVLFLMAIPMLIFIVYFYYHEIDSNNSGFIFNTFYFTLVSVTGTCMLPLFSSMKISGKPNFLQRFVTLTSIISYSLYLVHLSVVIRVISFTLRPFSGVHTFLSLVVFCIGSYLLASFLYRYFEKPMMDLRDKPYLNFQNIFQMKSKKQF